MRSPSRLDRYRNMSPAEKLREFAVLEAAARAVWRALPAEERRRRRVRLRRQRLANQARLLRALAGRGGRTRAPGENCTAGA